MISNMQQQNFDGVMNKMLTHETSGLCINNNNTNKNKNMNTNSSSGVMHNTQDASGFGFITPYPIHSSEHAKEYVTTASHTHQEEGFASLLDEISELIENHPIGSESAFNKNSDSHSKERASRGAISNVSNEPAPALPRNAFRFIEDVHNYSKLNRSDDSTNSSSPDDEEDFDDEDCTDDGNTKKEEDEEEYLDTDVIRDNATAKGDKVKTNSPQATPQITRVPEDDEEKTTPEHHARRPMNAFLIFCKRHRAIVRDKYKHLENRSITKILGEWWASLNAEEKISYTNLAKQYKDAFFSANPNFKWYKLPAPPLRTLSTRPGNTDRPLNHTYPPASNYETITLNNKDRNNRTISHYGNDSDEETLDASEVGVFKLADEAQMGGLNSLMKSTETHNHKTDPVARLTADQNVLQNAKVETITTAFIPLCKEDPFEKIKEHAAKMGGGTNQMVNGKRKSLEDHNMNGCKRQMLFNDSNISSGEEDILGKKSERSCKGKKYQELMNSGQIITFPKKSKSKLDMLSHSFNHNGYVYHSDNNFSPPLVVGGKVRFEDTASMDHNKSSAATTIESPVKQFDASDFDLEEKIKALPAQSLEEYLNRKREIKKKKKINSRRHKAGRNSTKEPPKTIQEAKERIQNQMVGSQKRKARKESITRRDITTTSIASPTDGQTHIYETLGLWTTAIKVEQDDQQQQPLDKVTNPTETTTSDLLILAEVAANHIEENA